MFNLQLILFILQKVLCSSMLLKNSISAIKLRTCDMVRLNSVEICNILIHIKFVLYEQHIDIVSLRPQHFSLTDCLKKNLIVKFCTLYSFNLNPMGYFLTKKNVTGTQERVLPMPVFLWVKVRKEDRDAEIQTGVGIIMSHIRK